MLYCVYLKGFANEWIQDNVMPTIQLTHWPLGNFNDILKYLIFQIISMIDGWDISCEIALRWMSLDLTDDKSTLVEVMA